MTDGQLREMMVAQVEEALVYPRAHDYAQHRQISRIPDIFLLYHQPHSYTFINI